MAGVTSGHVHKWGLLHTFVCLSLSQWWSRRQFQRSPQRRALHPPSHQPGQVIVTANGDATVQHGLLSKGKEAAPPWRDAIHYLKAISWVGLVCSRASYCTCCCSHRTDQNPRHLCVIQAKFVFGWWCVKSLILREDFLFFADSSTLSLQRCQSWPGIRYWWFLEHRRGQLHQSHPLCVWNNRSLRHRRTLRNAGMRLHSDITAQLLFHLHN